MGGRRTRHSAPSCPPRLAILPSRLALRETACQCSAAVANTAAGSPSAAATARHTAATAHHDADVYLAAFAGPGQQAQPPQLLCSGGGLACAAAGWAQPAAATAPTPAAVGPPPSAAWRLPPPTAPVRISLSDRNILCASVDWQWQEAVLGSTDHALYALDLRCGRRRKARTLYGRAGGHTEWVSAVCHLPGGRVASGGLDSRVWLWPPAGTACTPANCSALEGHGGSVAALAPVPAAPSCLLSAGYDKRLLCWDCSGRGKRQQALEGHRAPVLQLAAAGAWAASGDRDGGLVCWDLAAGKPVGGLLQAHTGHCTALEWWDGGSSSGAGSSSDGGGSEPRLLLSGGQDGAVKLWDARTGEQAAMAAHARPAGRGAVGSIVPLGHLLLTAGADCTVHGWDSRRSLQPAWEALQLPDFPYCAASCGSTLFVGCGDGSIAAVDAASGRLLYTLRAAAAAVRTLAASADLLIAGCDDGSAVLFEAAELAGDGVWAATG